MQTFLQVMGAAFAIGIGLLILTPIVLRLTEPFRIKRIRSYCEASGCTNVEIKSWRGHYGVALTKNGKKHYLKCRGTFRFSWIGQSPQSL
jgi:hypothetical protein